MNIALAREIDYWVGIPLCFFFTVIDRIRGLLGLRPRPSKSPKKFLFIELSEMGSSILAYPAMVKVKKENPGAELFFLIFKKNRASVDILKTIPKENVLTLNDKFLPAFFWDALKVVFRMRREGIDVAFDLELFARSSSLLTYLSNAPKRIGLYKYQMEGLYRGDLLTHRVQYNFQQHISKLFLTFVKVAKLSEKNSPELDEVISESEITPAVFNSNEEDLKLLREKLQKLNSNFREAKKIVILNPSAGEITIRGWPVENFRTLAKMISEDPETMIIVTGIESDRAVADQVLSNLAPKRYINMVSKTTFAELFNLYHLGDVFITNDSGPAHFASLTQIKNFVFLALRPQ